MLRRRYEILLPLKFNDGRPVSDAVLHQTREDLVQRFEAVSVQPQSLAGVWIHEGVRYEDISVKMTLDADDTPENREFFSSFKTTLLSGSSRSRSTSCRIRLT
jgi:hypothetical protein